MKNKLFIAHILLGFCFLGCAKSDNNELKTETQNYFFNCIVEGKTINLSYKPNSYGVSSNGVSLSSFVYTKIHQEATSKQCNTTGAYCITQVLELAAQTTGTYNSIIPPNVFLLSTTEGSDLFIYNSINGSVNVTISKIERGNGTNTTANQTGYLQGTFNGTVTKVKSNAITSINTTFPPVSITGSFSIPLPQ